MSIIGNIYKVHPDEFTRDERKPMIGGCGTIYFVTNNSTKEKCVLKQINLKRFLNIFRQEVETLSSCNHPAIIKFIGFAEEDQRNGNIYLKEAVKGSLENIIIKENNVMENGKYKNKFIPFCDNTQKLIIAYGVSCAMEYLHSKNVIHRDLKPGNILLDEFFFPYITDFGTSKIADDIRLTNTISQTTATIMPPEFLLDYLKYGREPSIDVYSFAIFLYNLLTELQAYPNLTELKIYDRVIKNVRPEFPNDDNNIISEQWKKLINECWDENPQKRPSFSEICDRLEGPEFLTNKIDQQRFEKYRQMVRITPKNEDKIKNELLLNPALQRGSISAMVKCGNMCEEDRSLGCPEIFFEMAADCCHCLDTEGFFFPANYNVYECKDCHQKICEGCAKACHKTHKILCIGTNNKFVCDCGKNHFTQLKGSKEKHHCSIEFVGEMQYGGAPSCYQHFYRCNTCNNESDDKLICKGCIESCHKGHDIADDGVKPGFCSCGAHQLDNESKCKASYYVNKNDGLCTCHNNSYPCLQRWFHCVTCGLIDSKENGICKSCAEKCHKGHLLLDRGVRRFKCQCHTTGKCQLNK